MSRDLPIPYRIPLLMMGFVCLALGIGGGLARLGWNFPLPSSSPAQFHGPLMVCGFLGTVIALERAVAIGRRWAYLAPLFAALGGAVIVSGQPQIGAGLLTLASAIFVIASMAIFLRQRVLFTLTLSLGAICWLVGNLLWLGGGEITRIIPWWIGFLVLTIAGERLELARLLPPSFAGKLAFVAILCIFLIGAALANIQTLSAALLALSFWLLRQDIARRTIKQHGLTRFIAACLLSGYAWLLAGSLVGLLSPSLMPGSSYDAFLHAIFVGFVFSMIFGHAPVIFPAIAKVKIPYHPSFYLPLIVLHISLVARFAGDQLQIPYCRSMGGAFNAAALLLFVLVTLAAIARGRRVNPNIHQPLHQP